MSESNGSIWHQPISLQSLEDANRDTLVSHLGIEFVDVGPDWLSARMPVDHRTCQPYGILHGGASVALAETLGSIGAVSTVDRARFRAFGQEINANHLRPATAGWVTGTARPVHLGRRSQVWSIEIKNDDGKLTCVSRLTFAIVAHGS